ncbi:MAG: polar amino acid transport system substrate-binding protein [Actinomycetota bacterium]|jgi:polar amino acid transport system substrate-binding protein|nr:polar amino acid transport system substrate-binding protein [Actinomycetota bacterium]MEA2487570.1 polar amino acid transport system substrate-binding protein [Actinomycetota bacterium]
MIRTASVCACALVVACSCVPPPAISTTPTKFPTDTVMGEIQSAGTLRIGIPDDRPIFSDFQKGLGTYLAEALHVSPGFVPAPNDQLLGMIDAGQVDVAFPAAPTTEKMARGYAVTNPYFIAHQRIAVPANSPISQLNQMAGRKVCSSIDPTTEVDPTSISELTVVNDDAQSCGRLLVHHKTDAVTASDASLISLVGKPISGCATTCSIKITGDELTTEGYGAVASNTATGLGDVISNIMERAQTDGTWTSLFKKWILPRESDIDPNAEPPTMTAEEAAALYPENATVAP